MFKGLDPVRNVNRVFDVVRGYLVLSDMGNMLMALNHLLAVCHSHQQLSTLELGDAKLALAKGLPRIRLVRVKNRLLHPTEGGWSDVMINLQVERPAEWNSRSENSESGSYDAATSDDDEDGIDGIGADRGRQHPDFSIICELQLINVQMHTVRHKMEGHRNYVKYRTAKEVMNLRRMQHEASYNDDIEASPGNGGGDGGGGGGGGGSGRSSARNSRVGILRRQGLSSSSNLDSSDSLGTSCEWVDLHQRRVAREQVDVAELNIKMEKVLHVLEETATVATTAAAATPGNSQAAAAAAAAAAVAGGGDGPRRRNV